MKHQMSAMKCQVAHYTTYFTSTNHCTTKKCINGYIGTELEIQKGFALRVMNTTMSVWEKGILEAAGLAADVNVHPKQCDNGNSTSPHLVNFPGP